MDGYKCLHQNTFKSVLWTDAVHESNIHMILSIGVGKSCGSKVRASQLQCICLEYLGEACFVGAMTDS